MKNLRFATVSASLLVSLGALGFACAHYDPNRPTFNKKTTPSPTFESPSTGKVNPIESENVQVLGGGELPPTTSTGGSPTIPVTAENSGRMTPDPMTGPGMSTTVPMPIPTANMPTPPSAPVKVETYEEAIAQIDKAKQRDPNLRNYWVGGGYDVLTGTRLPTCLEPSNLRTTVTTRMETTDSYSVAHDYRDLYNKLETEFGADIGGIWQIFSGSLSFKTKIMKETRMTTDDVVVVAGFTFLRDQIALQNPGLTYAEFFQSLSEKNRGLYRKYCGDRYTKDVSVGASMHLIFTAKKTDSLKHDQTKVDAAIRVGLAGILGFGASNSTSTEQKEILKSYSFTTKCYTLGATPDVCSGFSTSTAFDINSDVSAIQNKIQAVKLKMFAEAKEGKNLAVVRETLLDYDVPLAACDRDGDDPCPSRWQYFSDYRDRLTKLKKMSINNSEAEEVCSKTPYWSNRCARVVDLFRTSINNCLNLSEDCSEPNDNEFQTILSAKNPGHIELWDNNNYTGSFWGLDFRNLLNGNTIEPNRFYTLADVGMGKANDKITSIRSYLHPAWKIRFYRDGAASNAGQQYDVQGTRDVGNVGLEWKGANDSITSFQLFPSPDL